MIFNNKKLKELEKRIEALEKAISLPEAVPDDKEASYKEVIDEWLNGKRA